MVTPGPNRFVMAGGGDKAIGLVATNASRAARASRRIDCLSGKVMGGAVPCRSGSTEPVSCGGTAMAVCSNIHRRPERQVGTMYDGPGSAQGQPPWMLDSLRDNHELVPGSARRLLFRMRGGVGQWGSVFMRKRGRRQDRGLACGQGSCFRRSAAPQPAVSRSNLSASASSRSAIPSSTAGSIPFGLAGSRSSSSFLAIGWATG